MNQAVLQDCKHWACFKWQENKFTTWGCSIPDGKEWKRRWILLAVKKFFLDKFLIVSLFELFIHYKRGRWNKQTNQLTNKGTIQDSLGNMEESSYFLKVLFVLWIDKLYEEEDDPDWVWPWSSVLIPISNMTFSSLYSPVLLCLHWETRYMKNIYLFTLPKRLTSELSWIFYSSLAVPLSSQVINLLMGLE